MAPFPSPPIWNGKWQTRWEIVRQKKNGFFQQKGIIFVFYFIVLQNSFCGKKKQMLYGNNFFFFFLHNIKQNNRNVLPLHRPTHYFPKMASVQESTVNHARLLQAGSTFKKLILSSAPMSQNQVFFLKCSALCAISKTVYCVQCFQVV